MSFFKLPLWLLGLNSSTGTDKLLAVKDNGEVTQSSKTLDEIGLTPTLQDVLAEDNTAVTEGNWEFGSNRTRITSNNGVYVQDTNLQSNFKKNGVLFRDLSSNNSIEINFAGSTGTHAQVLQDKGGTIALLDDLPSTQWSTYTNIPLVNGSSASVARFRTKGDIVQIEFTQLSKGSSVIVANLPNEIRIPIPWAGCAINNTTQKSESFYISSGNGNVYLPHIASGSENISIFIEYSI